MLSIPEDVTQPPPPLHLNANPPPSPPSDIMPDSSSSMSSSIRKKMALISISPSPSTNSTPKRPYQQISKDTEMAVDLEHQSSSSPPRKVIKRSTGATIHCWWHIVCGCNVRYRIENIKSLSYRISAGETTIEVPFHKDHVHFDCPCGHRVELSTNVRRRPDNEKIRKITANALAEAQRYPVSRRLNTCTQTSQPPGSRDGGKRAAMIANAISELQRLPVARRVNTNTQTSQRPISYNGVASS